ncbi:hypothetical protein [Parvicella tangerina]|uniref:Uncharacterized protein n=1 Tax=Parvicella tangerina TaxID=2829795 RepID=A0A916JPC7_9FLAO|nr:hypothetical protein [Parvicella tangerina]CAG5082539.1 hypothetical protein CRYO30217_01945 [Parvicella tangerina]
MKKHKFEIEHWPNPFGKHALKRMMKGYVKGYIFFGAIFIISFGLAFGSKFLLGFTIPYTMWIARISGIVLIIAPLMPFLSYLQRDKKNPSYGINKDGFLLNERGWNSTFFTWDEIAWIKEYLDPKLGRELHFEFVNYDVAINKDPKFLVSLSREYETEKQPKRISMQLVKGDVNPFIDKFIQYYNDYKRKNPDLDQAGAMDLAKAYASENNFEFDFNHAQCERKEKFMNMKKPVWLISSNGNTIVVEIYTKKIPFVIDQDGKKKFPHMS